MSSIRRILVAIKDLRVAVRPVVRKAAQVASATGAQLEVYHSLSVPLPMDAIAAGTMDLSRHLQVQRLAAQKQLERIAAAVRALHPGLAVSVAAEWDAPVYDAIVRRALKIKADLIVAASHAGPHMLPGLMRLTDWELIRLSPTPLLLVRNPRPYRRPAVLVAVDPTHAFAKPLELDRSLLQLGAAISEGMRGTLHAVHAYVPVSAGTLAADAWPVTRSAVKRVEAEARRSAQRQLDRVLKGSPVIESRRYLIARHPVDAILQAARKSHSAIVIMGAMSRSGFRRLLIGNTAERMLDEIRCDTLVVKPAHFRNRVPRKVQGPRVVLPPPTSWPMSY